MIVQLQANYLEEISRALLEIIPHGAENAISSRKLEEMLDISHDTLRRCLRYLREGGAIICNSSTSPGIFKPDSPNECAQYLADERRRILALSRSIRAAELYADGISYYDLLTGGRGVKS